MTKSLQIGDTAPIFSLPTDDGTTITSTDFKGQKIILYFYPKDDTPGCTTESCGFRDNLPKFQKLGAVVFGVSKDSVASHVKFKTKYQLSFPLLSDAEGKTCEDYGVWVEKSMYGKTYMGIERSTFLIDEHGKIQKIWRKVTVDGHVDDVQTALSEL